MTGQQAVAQVVAQSRSFNAERWGYMRDCRGPMHEEDAVTRVICYLLTAFSMGLCVYLFIVIQK